MPQVMNRQRPWSNPVQEPPLSSRMYWDLAKEECPCCEAGEFPFTITDEGREHPDGMPCLAERIHKMFQAHIADPKKLDPFRQKLIMSKLDAWTPMTLAAIIRRCDEEYWRDNGRSLTLQDHEYDKVIKRLKRLAPDHPQLQVVGGGFAPAAPVKRKKR
jgi:hypothetical protein